MRVSVVFLLVLIFSTVVRADIVVTPPELSGIIRKIEQRQNSSGQLPAKPAQIAFKNDQIVFMQPSGKDIVVSFDGHSPTVDKHIRLSSTKDAYAFEVILQRKGKAYQHDVQKINGADALVFFSDDDVIIYTQQEGDDRTIVLKEWIYAKRPNALHGSEWVWLFKSEPQQWPLTLGMQENGSGAVYRNVPIKGVPIDQKARSGYMLNIMVKYKTGEAVKQYFPYSEEMMSMPLAQCTTREGTARAVDVHVENVSNVRNDAPPQKVGLDFSRWDEYWHSVYKMSVTAQDSEYPLFIE